MQGSCESNIVGFGHLENVGRETNSDEFEDPVMKRYVVGEGGSDGETTRM